MSANDAETPTLSGDRHAGRGRDVLELAAAGILPELVAADLVDEVDVGEAVAIDVRDREAVAVIVVRRLVRLAGVVDDAVLERDAALGQPVRELEVVERRERRPTALTCASPQLLEPRRVLQVVRDEADRRLTRRCLFGRRCYSRSGAEEKCRCDGRGDDGQRRKVEVLHFFVTVQVPLATSPPLPFSRAAQVPFAVRPSNVAVSVISTDGSGGKS